MELWAEAELGHPPWTRHRSPPPSPAGPGPRRRRAQLGRARAATSAADAIDQRLHGVLLNRPAAGAAAADPRPSAPRPRPTLPDTAASAAHSAQRREAGSTVVKNWKGDRSDPFFVRFRNLLLRSRLETLVWHSLGSVAVRATGFSGSVI